MVLLQKWPFFQLFFFRQYRPVNCLYDIPRRKNAFLGFKTNKFKKSKKIDIFPKGLTHSFGIKIGIFRTFFLKQSRPGKCFLKSRNIHIFPKGVNPWFWSKNCHFSNMFFLGNICQENIFYDILKRKNAFLGYRNKKFKKSKE